MSIQFSPDSQSKRLIDEFNAGSTPSKMVYIYGKQNMKPAKISLELECLGDIIVGEFNHSMFTKFLGPDDLDKFVEIENEAINFLPKDIEFKSMLKDDKMFVKLPVKGDRYNLTFDPPVSPNHLDKSCLHQGSFVDLEFQPNIWVNFEKRLAGLFIKIYSITIDGGRKKMRNR